MKKCTCAAPAIGSKIHAECCATVEEEHSSIHRITAGEALYKLNSTDHIEDAFRYLSATIIDDMQNSDLNKCDCGEDSVPESIRGKHSEWCSSLSENKKPAINFRYTNSKLPKARPASKYFYPLIDKKDQWLYNPGDTIRDKLSGDIYYLVAGGHFKILKEEVVEFAEWILENYKDYES